MEFKDFYSIEIFKPHESFIKVNLQPLIWTKMYQVKLINLLQELNEIPSIEYNREFKRRHFKEKNYFKSITRIILLLIKSQLTRRKYGYNLDINKIRAQLITSRILKDTFTENGSKTSTIIGTNSTKIMKS